MEKQKEVFTCAIEHGAMTDAPIYDSHVRAKNWLAVIHAEPTAPGGIGRTFARRANGDYRYMADSLSIGTPVEFGADYYTGSGRKRSNRWYGVVVAMTDDNITIQKADDAREAIEMAETVQETAATSEAEFVAILGFTEDGKTKFFMNPLQWTTSLDSAHKWTSGKVAKLDMEAMGVAGTVVPVIIGD